MNLNGSWLELFLAGIPLGAGICAGFAVAEGWGWLAGRLWNWVF